MNTLRSIFLLVLLPLGRADSLTLRFKAPHWLSIEGDHLPGKVIEVNYLEAYRRRLGTVSAKVSSAVALSAAQRAQIEAAILASGAKSVEITEEVNPDLIGGLVVRVGDKQIDTSIAQSLRSLDRSFQKNLYIADF